MNHFKLRQLQLLPPCVFSAYLSLIHKFNSSRSISEHFFLAGLHASSCRGTPRRFRRLARINPLALYALSRRGFVQQRLADRARLQLQRFAPPRLHSLLPANQPALTRRVKMATAMNGGEKKCSNLDGQAPESTDFANYFCTYGYIYHQVRHLYCPLLRTLPALSSVGLPRSPLYYIGYCKSNRSPFRVDVKGNMS